MNWSRISGNWPHWRDRIRERWGRLSSNELDAIAGRREHLVGRIQEAYGLPQAEVERQLRNWERNLAVDEFDEAELVLDEDDDSASINGRG
jgi:uncharacterized protein YjbJ (UPF0337 family)